MSTSSAHLSLRTSAPPTVTFADFQIACNQDQPNDTLHGLIKSAVNPQEAQQMWDLYNTRLRMQRPTTTQPLSSDHEVSTFPGTTDVLSSGSNATLSASLMGSRVLERPHPTSTRQMQPMSASFIAPRSTSTSERTPVPTNPIPMTRPSTLTTSRMMQKAERMPLNPVVSQSIWCAPEATASLDFSSAVIFSTTPESATATEEEPSTELTQFTERLKPEFRLLSRPPSNLSTSRIMLQAGASTKDVFESLSSSSSSEAEVPSPVPLKEFYLGVPVTEKTYDAFYVDSPVVVDANVKQPPKVTKQTLGAELKALNAQLQRLEEDFNDIEQQLLTAQERARKHEELSSQQTEALEEAEEELATLSTQYAAEQKEHLNEVRSLEERLEALDKDLKEETQRCTNQGKNLLTYTQEIARLKGEKKDFQFDSAALKARENEVEALREKAKTHKAALKAETQNRLTEKSKYKVRLAELYKCVDNSRKLIKDLENQLATRKQELTDQIQRHQTELQKKDETIVDLETNLEDKNAELHQLMDVATSSTSAPLGIKEETNNIKQLKTRLASVIQLEQEMAQLKEQNKALETQLRQAENKYSRKKEQLKERTEDTEIANADHQNQVRMLEARIHTLQTTVEQQTLSATQTQHTIATMEADRASADEALGNLQNRLSSLKEKHHQGLTEVSTLRQRAQTLELECRTATNRANDLQSILVETLNHQNSLQTSLDKATQKTTDLEEKLDQLQTVNPAVETLTKANQNLHSTIDAMYPVLERLRKAIVIDTTAKIAGNATVDRIKDTQVICNQLATDPSASTGLSNAPIITGGFVEDPYAVVSDPTKVSSPALQRTTLAKDVYGRYIWDALPVAVDEANNFLTALANNNPLSLEEEAAGTGAVISATHWAHQTSIQLAQMADQCDEFVQELTEDVNTQEIPARTAAKFFRTIEGNGQGIILSNLNKDIYSQWIQQWIANEAGQDLQAKATVHRAQSTKRRMSSSRPAPRGGSGTVSNTPTQATAPTAAAPELVAIPKKYIAQRISAKLEQVHTSIHWLSQNMAPIAAETEITFLS